MFTYDVVSESVRNPHQLAAELTKRSSEGWEVVQITYDGAAWFHAFLRHQGSVSVAPRPGFGSASPVSESSATVSGPLGVAQTSAPDASGNVVSSPSVPANWYKDPSGRYELRYWNGSAWTEHVATGGVQSTDAPRS
jgi:hypothetical protein